jgi:hypothetical protein
VTISLHVQPRARRVALEASAQGDLKAWVTAAPEDGKANDAVIALLGKSWRLPKSAFALKTGATSRDKVFSVTGEPQALAVRIGDWVRGNV